MQATSVCNISQSPNYAPLETYVPYCESLARVQEKCLGTYRCTLNFPEQKLMLPCTPFQRHAYIRNNKLTNDKHEFIAIA